MHNGRPLRCSASSSGTVNILDPIFDDDDVCFFRLRQRSLRVMWTGWMRRSKTTSSDADTFSMRGIERLIIYFRKNVLPPSVANYSKDSPEFMSALYSAATVTDCASLSDPFDLEYRTRFIWDSFDLACKAFFMGLEYPADAAEMQAECPPVYCLGTFCQEVRVRDAP